MLGTQLCDPCWEKNRHALFALEDEVRKLRAFKAYVHRRLDEAGIPQDPGGPHSASGCRVGDRLDIALAAYKECMK